MARTKCPKCECTNICNHCAICQQCGLDVDSAEADQIEEENEKKN